MSVLLRQPHAKVANLSEATRQGGLQVLALLVAHERQGRKDDAESRKIDARFCKKGRQMAAGPRKLCVGSTAKTIRL